MEKEWFIKNLWSQKEDTYTDFWYLHWEIMEGGKNWFCDLLIGDVTQIEQGEDFIAEDGYRKQASKINVITKDGTAVSQSYGFTASVNKNPIIGKKRWNMLDEVEGISANFMLHRGIIYNNDDVVFIDAYQTRDLARKTMIEKFWDDNQEFLQTIPAR